MKQNKFSYASVIQQYFGERHGWEDVSEHETDSRFNVKEMSDKPAPNGRKESCLTYELREYRLLGYPTRVVQRRKERNDAN